MTPKDTQLVGAKFLAKHKYALLADKPRVGKTGASIIAADYVMAQNILVITTASGRGVWKAGFPAWSGYARRMQIIAGKEKLLPDTEIAIVGWAALTQPHTLAALLKRHWHLIIVDEAHNAKSFEARRTRALYGTFTTAGGAPELHSGLYMHADRVWLLTGTPLPNSPADAYPMMRALFSDRLLDNPPKGWPDVSKQSDFITRYCKMRPMKIGHGFHARTIQVFVEGRNLAELNARMEGMHLQRTQADVGILEPEYETMPLIAPSALPLELTDARAQSILAAAIEGRKLTPEEDMHMGPLRRLTGEIKAPLVVEAVKEELDNGLPKIVLAYWHKDVGAALAAGLTKYGVTGIDGSTPDKIRTANVKQFATDKNCRVFLAQIQAAGEAIDLSAAADLIFVETSWVPKDQLQMALRVCNYGQKRRPLVRVATLADTVDDGLQSVLMRKWSAIREAMK